MSVRVSRLLATVDRLQQRNAVLGFLFAAYRKANDDRVSSLAALFAYYALFAIFPLLLILVTLLGLLLHSDPSLRQRILNSALSNFPIIGPELKAKVDGLSSNFGLGVGLVTLLLATRGLSSLASRAMNDVWNVPNVHRVGFPASLGRTFLWTIIVGVGITGSTLLSGSRSLFPLSLVGSLLVNVAVFTSCARVLLERTIPTRSLLLGSVLGALLWQVLQFFGAVVVEHELQHANAIYGFFGIVIGLLTWMYLQAYLTLLAMEVDVVRTRRLWPRGLQREHPTSADLTVQSYQMFQVERE
ncbi:MAG: YihY/virulence factor BrkB family protein [Acidimicrobiales bacterium]